MKQAPQIKVSQAELHLKNQSQEVEQNVTPNQIVESNNLAYLSIADPICSKNQCKVPRKSLSDRTIHHQVPESCVGHSTDDESTGRSRSDLLAKSQSSQWNSVDDVHNEEEEQQMTVDIMPDEF